MNRIEKIIHTLIGNYPFIKIPLVFLYQSVLSLIPMKNYQISKVIEMPGYFFGFHDKCPWSHDDLFILAHNFDQTKSLKKIENMPIRIGIFDQTNNQLQLLKFKPISESSAWNWQQGSNAQWIGDKNKIIFNDISHEKCISKIIDTKGEIESIFPFHIANTTHNGHYAFTYSFARLGRGMSGYGYHFGHNLNTTELSNKSLGVLNLETEKHVVIFNVDEFYELNFEDSMRNSFGFFSHCISSLNSKRFVFLHRWINKFNRLRTRMYSADIDGSNLFKFPLEDCSHIAWFDNQYILAYCKPFNKEYGYYLIKDLNVNIKKIMKNFILSDGHPQVSLNCKNIITDTYPDRFRRQYLKIFDIKSSREVILGVWRIPFQYRLKRRCDFHPRWNRSNSMICFDSTQSGVRSLCLIQSPFK